MGVIDWIKSKFNKNKRLTEGKNSSDYIDLLDKMFLEEEAFKQFTEYKKIREENPKMKPKKIEIEGPYTKMQLEMLLNNPNFKEALENIAGIYEDKPNVENYMKRYNSVLEKYDCYKLIDRECVEEYHKEMKEIYITRTQERKRRKEYR